MVPRSFISMRDRSSARELGENRLTGAIASIVQRIIPTCCYSDRVAYSLNIHPETKREVSQAVITQIRGMLRSVAEEELTLAIDPIEIAVLIPEHTRRLLQQRVGEFVSLHTVLYIEGGQMGARMNPRLVGFLSPVDREFFEVFCSVDGVGVRKALRAMARPVRELARAVQDQDVRLLATYPGIGEATAERIVAKLRRKVGKFALIVGQDAAEGTPPQETNGGSRQR